MGRQEHFMEMRPAWQGSNIKHFTTDSRGEDVERHTTGATCRCDPRLIPHKPARRGW